MTHEVSNQDLLEQITDYYLESNDFNGLPLRDLFGLASEKVYMMKSLSGLIKDDKVSIVFGNVHPNPHIRALPDIAKEEQISLLNKAVEADSVGSACVYPLQKHLIKTVDSTKYQSKPYMLEMALGSPQLDFRSFDLSVLEIYRNDPRYVYENDDIGGFVSVSDEHFESSSMPESDQVLLETFGFCYDKDLNRSVAVYVRYLADLSPEHQQLWKSRELEGNYRLHPDYYRNSILGEFGRGISIFDAFIEELRTINDMSDAMNRPHLFRHDYQTQKPRKFGFLVRPTLESYSEFVLLLDKMLSDNINAKFFGDELPNEREIERQDGKIMVERIGSLQMLELWTRTYFRTDDWQPLEEMTSAFKNVRKQRQKPAHAVNNDVFDQKYVHAQRDLMVEVYAGLRTLRLLLANHPKVQSAKIEIQQAVQEGKIWTY